MLFVSLHRRLLQSKKPVHQFILWARNIFLQNYYEIHGNDGRFTDFHHAPLEWRKTAQKLSYFKIKKAENQILNKVVKNQTLFSSTSKWSTNSC